MRVFQITACLTLLIQHVLSVFRIDRVEQNDIKDWNGIKTAKYFNVFDKFVFYSRANNMRVLYNSFDRYQQYKATATFSLDQVLKDDQLKNFILSFDGSKELITIVAGDPLKLYYVQFFDGEAVKLRETLLDEPTVPYYNAQMFQQETNPFIYTFLQNTGSTKSVLKKWSFTSGTPIKEGFRDQNYDQVFGNIGRGLGQFLICKGATQCDLVSDRQFNVLASATSIGGALPGPPTDFRSALYYPDTNFQARNKEILMGTNKAQIIMRSFTSSTSINEKVITISNATRDNSFLREMVGVMETQYVLSYFMPFYIYMINPQTQPGGASDAVIFQQMKYESSYSDVMNIALLPAKGITNFYMLSQASQGLIRTSLCGGYGCNKCTANYDNCLGCDFGQFLVEDSFNGDKHCISSCPNKTIEMYDPGLARCVHCIDEYSLISDPDVCYMTQAYNLQKAPPSHRDEFSSFSVEISVKNSSEALGKFPRGVLFDWTQVFKAELTNVPTNEYDIKLGIRNRLIILDFNFTKEYDNVELLVTRLKQLVYLDPDTGEAVMVLSNADAKFNFRAQIPVDAATLKGMKATGSAFGSVAGAAGIAGLSVSVGAAVFQFPGLGFFIKFLMMFKILDRFKLINIYYGPILGAFLDAIGNILNLSGGADTDEGFKFNTKTRGKLSQYHIDNLALYRMPLKYGLYMITWFMDIPRMKFWRYAGSLKNMSPGDRTYSIISEKIRFLLFTAFVSDIFLFSLNELIHHDLNVSQNNHVGLSYGLAFVCMILMVYDTIDLLIVNNTYITVQKTERPPIPLGMSPRIDHDESAIAALNRSAFRGSGEEEKGTHLDGFRKKTNLSILKGDEPTYKKRSKTFALRSIDTKNEKPTKAELKKKYQSYLEYFAEGLGPGMMQNSKVSKYYNTAALLRLILFEPFIVSMQLFPTLQVLIILGLQTAFLIMTILAVFKYKIFKNCAIKLNFLFNELFLFLFLCLATYLSQTDTDQFSGKSFQTLQMGVITVIMIMAGFNVLIFIAVLVISTRRMIIKIREKKKKKDILRKTLLDKNMAEAAAFSQNQQGIDNIREEPELKKKRSRKKKPKRKRRKKKPKKKLSGDSNLLSDKSKLRSQNSGSSEELGRKIKKLNKKKNRNHRNSKIRQSYIEKVEQEGDQSVFLFKNKQRGGSISSEKDLGLDSIENVYVKKRRSRSDDSELM